MKKYIILVITLLIVISIAVLLFIKNQRPRAAIVRHGIEQNGKYSLDIDFKNIPYNSVYFRYVISRISKDKTVDTSGGSTSPPITDGKLRIKYVFPTDRFLNKHVILLPTGTPIVEFKEGEREIKVFEGQNESGEKCEAFIGIGPLPIAEQDAGADGVNAASQL